MGVNDAKEQLEVAKAECVRLEERVVALAAAVRLAKDVATGLSADTRTYRTGRLLWDILSNAE